LKGGGKMEKRYFLGWNRKGVMMSYILFTIVVSLSLWIMPLPAVAMTLHPHGDWTVSCNTGFLESYKFDKTTSKNTYTFKGQCGESAGESVINRRYQINASWNASTKTASENISAFFSPQGLGTRTGSIFYTCPDDPWINTVNCTITSKAGNIFDLELNLVEPIKYPISANFISSSKKHSLKAEWATKGAFLATPEAPFIQSPSPNQKFFSPVTVHIQVQHNPNYSIAFQFQRAELVSKPNIPNLWGNEHIVLSNIKVDAGITTGDLSINKPGKWRFRAQCSFANGNAPWSGWTEFSVDTMKGMHELSPAGKPGK
jgi:hypothetical protein